jgi:hypothetical protein
LAKIAARVGPLPVGEHNWSFCCNSRWQTQKITTQLSHTAQEVTEQTEKLLATKMALYRANKEAAQSQLATVKAVRIFETFSRQPRKLGGLLSQYLDVYVAAGEHEGWQRFRSAERQTFVPLSAT